MVQIKSLTLQQDLHFPFWGTKVCLEIAFKPLFGGEWDITVPKVEGECHSYCKKVFSSISKVFLVLEK